MKQLLLLALLGLGTAQSAFAQTYVMQVPQMGLKPSPLKVVAVAPNSGPFNEITPFTVTGEFFDESVMVEVGGIVATCDVASKTSVSCTSPLQPTAGVYPVAVIRQDGSRDTTKSFTYTPTPLKVNVVSPNVGLFGSATPFVVTGENFDKNMVVSVGSVVAKCDVPTKTSVSCESPLQSVEGTYQVTVRRPDGDTDASKVFTYTPTGPAGVLVKIMNGQISGLALSADNQLLYLNGTYVNKVNSTGASLGQVFAGSSSSRFGTPSGCNGYSTPSLYSLAVDASGQVYLGGSCGNSSGLSSAAVWKVSSGTYASTLTSAWGGSDNHNAVKGLSVSGNSLYARFWTNYATSTYHAAISTANGARTNLGTGAIWASTVAHYGSPYIINTSGRLAKFSGNTWTPIGAALSGNPDGSHLTAADGFLYYLPSNGTVLYKLDPATGAAAKTWPLSGLVGAPTGLAVNAAGKPFISTGYGIWRMD